MNKWFIKNRAERESSNLRLIPLYKNFFRFLDRLKRGESAWLGYWRHYYFPHRQFFNAYFSLFPLLDRQALKWRVEAIRPNHYDRLRSILSHGNAEKIIRQAHQRCLKLVKPERTKLIKVYLIIGFFSPEAFILSLGEEKVIVFGLERFRDLSSLDLFYAHEYAHFLLKEKIREVTKENEALWYLLSEGLACWFTSFVLPERPLTDHLFLRRDRLNWCLENESLLVKIFNSKKDDIETIMRIEQYGDQAINLPPRTLHFLGYRAIEKYLKINKKSNFFELLSQPEKLLSLKLEGIAEETKEKY